tara:strand:- start:1467 stop:2963 length:1497 start_codon:yes stop_codon:yes gene_type:complete
MSNWKRTALGSGGAESSRNVLYFNTDGYSGYSYFYRSPDNMITTKTSGNMLITYNHRAQQPTGTQKVTIYDPYFNVLADGQPLYIFGASNNNLASKGLNHLTDASVGASGSYGQDDVVVGYQGASADNSVIVKATGTPSTYTYKERQINNNYYNSSSSWYNAQGWMTHFIGDKAYDIRNHNSSGWAFMSYKYPPWSSGSWYSSSQIQGQNPGRYISSGGICMFEPLSPTSMTTDFIIGYSIPYSGIAFKTMTHAGAAQSSGREGYVAGLSSSYVYWSRGQIDRANNTAYMFDSDSMTLVKWNYSNGTITLYQVSLPGGSRTQFCYPMVFLNGYIYLMGYYQNNSTGAMYIIRMLASNPTSSSTYKVWNTQGGTRQLSNFQMVPGPNNFLGETDLLSLAFEYKSASSRTEMIVANMLFTDIPELSSSGKVGAKLSVAGATTTITNVTSSYTIQSYANSSGISTMYSGNQGVGFPGIVTQDAYWSSRTASFASGVALTSL